MERFGTSSSGSSFLFISLYSMNNHQRVEELARKDEFIRSKMALIGLWHNVTDDEV